MESSKEREITTKQWASLLTFIICISLYLINQEIFTPVLIIPLLILFPLWVLMIISAWKMVYALHYKYNYSANKSYEKPHSFSPYLIPYIIFVCLIMLLPAMFTSNPEVVSFNKEDTSFFYAGALMPSSVCIWYYWLVEPFSKYWLGQNNSG